MRRLTRKLAQFQIQGVLFLIMPNAHIQTAGRSLMTAASAAMRRSGGADSSEGKEASGKGPICMCSTVEPSLLGWMRIPAASGAGSALQKCRKAGATVTCIARSRAELARLNAHTRRKRSKLRSTKCGFQAEQAPRYTSRCRRLQQPPASSIRTPACARVCGTAARRAGRRGSFRRDRRCRIARSPRDRATIRAGR